MKYTRQLGMTLVEMLVVIGLYTVLTTIVFTSAQSLYFYNASTFAQSNEVEHAMRGMYRWSQDVREMTYAEDGAFPIVVKDPHTIAFYSDIDRDNNVEYVEYEVATTTLYKRTYNPIGNPPAYNFSVPDQEEILSEYVQNINQSTSTFYYYDSDGVSLGTGALLTDVRYIKIQLIVNINPIRDPGEFLLRSGVAPRNLKDNL
ncbi:MAG: type II secretion system protein [Candidatus Pacebacteria bacterium]|nr:type II secretion system protein [Candidatus Paceibacterota bacterium]MBP9843161.1 type II secretion system protein [Candidatus Paceibacterota bacterium]